MKRILMILASENFRDIEYIVPRAFFEQNDIEVKTASSAKESTGKHGYKVMNDYLIEEAEASYFDGIYFVGGQGALEYVENVEAKVLAEKFFTEGKAVGAICAAPRNFLKWGMLKNKEATGHNWDGNFENLSLQNGAKPRLDKKVIISEGIMTANGPEAAEESALEFMKLIKQAELQS